MEERRQKSEYYTTHITPTNLSSSTIFYIGSLKLSDATTYTCHVNVSSNPLYVLSDKASESIDVSVKGKYYNFILFIYIPI